MPSELPLQVKDALESARDCRGFMKPLSIAGLATLHHSQKAHAQSVMRESAKKWWESVDGQAWQREQDVLCSPECVAGVAVEPDVQTTRRDAASEECRRRAEKPNAIKRRRVKRNAMGAD